MIVDYAFHPVQCLNQFVNVKEILKADGYFDIHIRFEGLMLALAEFVQAPLWVWVYWTY